MSSIVTILGSPNSFLDQLFQKIRETGIDITQLYLDHICYRVATLERYESLKMEVSAQAKLLTESTINGRPIASYLLHNPIQYKDRSINCLELPAPKEGSYYEEGFEHVEFVIRDSFEEFMAKTPDISFQTKGMTKEVNADITLKFGKMAVKFHHHPLPYVIKYLD